MVCSLFRYSFAWLTFYTFYNILRLCRFHINRVFAFFRPKVFIVTVTYSRGRHICRLQPWSVESVQWIFRVIIFNVRVPCVLTVCDFGLSTLTWFGSPPCTSSVFLHGKNNTPRVLTIKVLQIKIRILYLVNVWQKQKKKIGKFSLIFKDFLIFPFHRKNFNYFTFLVGGTQLVTSSRLSVYRYRFYL